MNLARSGLKPAHTGITGLNIPSVSPGPTRHKMRKSAGIAIMYLFVCYIGEYCSCYKKWNDTFKGKADKSGRIDPLFIQCNNVLIPVRTGISLK